MAAHVTVYCARGVDGVRAAALREDFEVADFLTLAEGYGGIDDARADEAAASVQVHGAAGLAGAEVRYGADERPIQLTVWSEEMVREMIAELGAELEALSDDGAARVRGHLARTVAIVDLELGWEQVDEMGGVFAERAAFWIARQVDGLVEFYGASWYAGGDRTRAVFER